MPLLLGEGCRRIGHYEVSYTTVPRSAQGPSYYVPAMVLVAEHGHCPAEQPLSCHAEQ